jgi:hypothetical protein
MTTDDKVSNASDPASNALPWKNSLLIKENPDTLQNPLNYFKKIIVDNDNFSNLYEDIIEKREAGELVEYKDWEDGKIKNLEAFLIIQDLRGTHWICPVLTHEEPIDQKVCPLKSLTEDSEEAYRDTESFGHLTILRADYISACSRGFENASRLFLGDRSAKLQPDYRLIAAFYVYPKDLPR